jgi:hypothetical protein
VKLILSRKIRPEKAKIRKGSKGFAAGKRQIKLDDFSISEYYLK